MTIDVECPRCHAPVAVPEKLAGGQVTCPRCEKLFLSARPGSAARGAQLALPPRPSAPVTAPTTPATPPAPPGAPPPPKPGRAAVFKGAPAPAAPPAAPPPSTLPPSPAPPALAPARATPDAPPPASAAVANAPAADTAPVSKTAATPASAAKPSAPVKSAGQRKVARFIAADAAPIALPLAEGGKLPELHLQEGEAAAGQEKKGAGLNPLVLFGLLALSTVMSLVLAFVDVEPRSATDQQTTASARQVIREEYLGTAPRLPYQIYLREAQQAWARHDEKAEHEYYRRVLALLRAEREPMEAVTGSRTRDRRLEEQLTILLSQ